MVKLEKNKIKKKVSYSLKLFLVLPKSYFEELLFLLICVCKKKNEKYIYITIIIIIMKLTREEEKKRINYMHSSLYTK